MSILVVNDKAKTFAQVMSSKAWRERFALGPPPAADRGPA